MNFETYLKTYIKDQVNPDEAWEDYAHHCQVTFQDYFVFTSYAIRYYRLQQKRIVNGRERVWTQADLGETVGVTARHISLWETGKRLPPLDALYNLARALKISPRRLLKP